MSKFYEMGTHLNTQLENEEQNEKKKKNPGHQIDP